VAGLLKTRYPNRRQASCDDPLILRNETSKYTNFQRPSTGYLTKRFLKSLLFVNLSFCSSKQTNKQTNAVVCYLYGRVVSV